MGIFTNNVTPTVRVDKSWNNIGYEAWIQALNESYSKGFRGSGIYWSAVDPDWRPNPWYKSKSQLKTELKQSKKLTVRHVQTLDKAVDLVYSKYGVWLKWKVQVDKNKHIKSIYFVRFC